MEKVINPYTLTFRDKELELQYQAQTIQKTLKPFYYAILFSALIMYTMQLFIVQITQGELLLVNLCIISAVAIILIIIYKKENMMQLCITIANCLLLLNQINKAVDQSIPNQYSYLNGCLFTSLQTGLCFTIDFKYSLPALIFQLIFRFSVLTYYVQSFDFMMLLLGLIAMSFISSALYICNKAQRLQFLMNIKDDTITKQLETLIKQPFSKIKYNIDKLQIEVLMVKDLGCFIGYQDDLCTGCNIRNFLRNCKYNNQNLELGIAKGILPLNQSITVINNKIKIIIRICDYNIDSSFILIQESIISSQTIQNNVPVKLLSELNKQISIYGSSNNSQVYILGVMSVLMMNNKQIKTINLQKMFNKLKNIYNFQGNIVFLSQNYSGTKLRTYAFLFKIFFIQIFNICSELKTKNITIENIELIPQEICLTMKIQMKQPEKFLKYYYQNFFIEQFSEMLLVTPVFYDLEFQFNKYEGFQ